ncbi:MAG: hypothetical protein Q7T03_05260 [Deltaproteobacteria bacterium]|nr:hypothetical protein [Deltaproteobacteria bacterium]
MLSNLSSVLISAQSAEQAATSLELGVEIGRRELGFLINAMETVSVGVGLFPQFVVLECEASQGGSSGETLIKIADAFRLNPAGFQKIRAVAMQARTNKTNALKHARTEDSSTRVRGFLERVKTREELKRIETSVREASGKVRRGLEDAKVALEGLASSLEIFSDNLKELALLARRVVGEPDNTEVIDIFLAKVEEVFGVEKRTAMSALLAEDDDGTRTDLQEMLDVDDSFMSALIRAVRDYDKTHS